MVADSLPWICVYPKEDVLTMVLEITIQKLRQTQLGVIFKQEQIGIVVDSVTPFSSAHKSGLKSGDVVLAIENKTVSSVPQVAKLIRSISTTNITLRVERNAENYILKSKFEKTEIKVRLFCFIYSYICLCCDFCLENFFYRQAF